MNTNRSNKTDRSSKSNKTNRSSKSNKTNRSSKSNKTDRSDESIESDDSTDVEMSDDSNASTDSNTSNESSITTDSSKKKSNDGLRVLVTMKDQFVLGLVKEEVLLQITILSLAGNCSMLTNRVCFLLFLFSYRRMARFLSLFEAITQTNLCNVWSPGSSRWPSYSPPK